ncbi:mitogen-activated protein kinase kinase 10 [Vigna unguiculata]|uniref:mitogen-activated protein kinase kinase 10 n=1 Tax=Vigna unguiculata TaxID=3917 RepID=UPI001015DB65|nr:mitogen-activated protein kinase kinase 10 [Vigna unguiculata]
MTLVIRERRHKQALSLSLPKSLSIPSSNSDSPHQIHVPVLTSPSSSSSSSHVHSSPSIIKDLSDLEKREVLGHGNGGTVYKVYHTKTRSFYALKVLRLNGIRQPVEAEILKRVDSPYIVKCHAVFDSGNSNNDGDKRGDISFVMEYMEGGSLNDVLRQHRILSEKVISVLARRVLEGLGYLHGMNIVHRDIKPSNLLINGKGEVKIADFGVSHVVEGRFEGNENDAGTCAYMSPERIDPERWGGENADEFAGDVWSMGVVMLECLLGYFPLIGAGQRPDWATLMCAICFGEKLEMPEKASPEFQNFVRRCLEKNWRKRATVLELLHHPFVS